MRRKFQALILTIYLTFSSFQARADLFGGDVVVLTQILVQSIQTVLQLKAILTNGSDTLQLLNNVNSGISSAVALIKIINPKFNPGTYGDLRDPQNVLRALEDIYGAIPKGMDHDLIATQDQSVAEVIAMNRNLFDYADQVDVQRDQLMQQASFVSPQGAGRLQGQALSVLIGVMTQVLRTQSQMLKVMAQNMAMENRREKLSTQNFHDNYESLSKGFEGLPQETKLPKLGGGR